VPILDVEVIDDTYEEDPEQQEFFTQLHNIEKINSQQLESLARDKDQYNFVVFSCQYGDAECNLSLKQLDNFGITLNRKAKMYFMDSALNRVYLKDANPKRSFTDYKIGIYWKGEFNLYMGQPFYRD